MKALSAASWALISSSLIRVFFNVSVLSSAITSSIAAFNSSPSENFLSAVVIAASVLIVVPPNFTVTPLSNAARRNSFAYSFSLVKSAPLSIMAPKEAALALNLAAASFSFSASDLFIYSSRWAFKSVCRFSPLYPFINLSASASNSLAIRLAVAAGIASTSALPSPFGSVKSV